MQSFTLCYVFVIVTQWFRWEFNSKQLRQMSSEITSKLWFTRSILLMPKICPKNTSFTLEPPTPTFLFSTILAFYLHNSLEGSLISFFFSLLSMVTLKWTFKKHRKNLPGFQKGKKETKMNDTYQSGLVHNLNHFLNMFSGPPLLLPDGLEPLCEILFSPLLSSRAQLSRVTKCTFT